MDVFEHEREKRKQRKKEQKVLERNARVLTV
jgi:hypothetical protein